MQNMLDRVSRTPQLWNLLRWVVEAGFRGEHAVIARELVPFQDRERRFLDFGCGTGQFAADFPADRYVGMDLTRPYIAYAGATRPGQYSVMDGSALGLEDASFDAALVLGVFHHLPDQLVRDSIGELHRVLKPGATLLVMEDVPPPSIWNLPGHLMHWLDRGDHIRSDADYRALFAPHFSVRRSYHMRSGICDYGVYVLARQW
ncbi:MAG TPA: class I SAM-dependent methyltransferase [Herpetosiphonaceae bacterium]